MRHQFIRAERLNSGTRRWLKCDKARWATEFEDPIEAATARSEAIAFCGDQECNGFAPSTGDHRRQRVDFGVDVMRPKLMLDIAADEDLILDGEHGHTNARWPVHTRSLAYIPS